MTEWNKAFWAIFIILGAIIIAGSMVHILYMDIIFGLLVIGVGAAKLAEEITNRRLQRKHAAMNESINYLTRQVDSTTGTTERLRDTNDSRFFKIDHRLSNINEKMDGKYDDAVKKVIGLENRLNEHSKLMLELAKRQEIIKERQAAVGERLRHLPRAQPKPAFIRVPEQKHQPIFVPKAATTPEKKIMRFELPKVAPRTHSRIKPRRRPKAKNAKHKTGRRIVTSGKTIINIQAPKTRVIKKIVSAKAKTKARPKRVYKPKRAGKALNKKKTKKVAKNISINIS